MAATIQQVQDYPLSSRFVPFSLVWYGFQSHSVVVKTNETKLHMYVQKFVTEQALAPVDAGLVVQDGRLAVRSGKTGLHYSAATMALLLTGAVEHGQTQIDLRSTPQQPKISDAAVRVLLPSAQRQIDAGLTIGLGNRTVSPDKMTLANWFGVTYDQAKNRVALAFDQPAVERYLENVKGKLEVAAGTTVVRLVDGHEMSRQDGLVGRSLAPGASQAIVTALAAQKPVVSLPAVMTQPNVTSTRSYSNSQAGLQTLLNYLVAVKGTYGIAVREISGRGWSASANGGKSFVTASTYKLFVSYSTLKRIEGDQFDWSDPTVDTDLSTCFDRMIVQSDNPCAEALGERIGWDTVISEMQELGLTETTQSDTFYSTADNEALLLTQLARGQILSQDSRDRLIDRMEHQVYRQGIPAGTGVLVADKVGFLWGLLHDAAIVYSPKSTYVLVILTDGSSWAEIADTAKQIEAQMER